MADINHKCEHSRAESMGTMSLLRKNLVVTALGHHTNTFLPCSRLWTCIFSTRVWATGSVVPCVYAFRWVASDARSIPTVTTIDRYVVLGAILGGPF